MKEQFRKVTITHKPKVEELWVFKMPIDFKIFGRMGERFKVGDYLTIETEGLLVGYVGGKKKEEVE